MNEKLAEMMRELAVPNPPLDDDTLAEVEKRLGVKLPAAYVELMREQNGGNFETMVIRVQRRLPRALAQHFGDDRHVEINALAGITLEESRSVLHTRYMIGGVGPAIRARAARWRWAHLDRARLPEARARTASHLHRV